MKHWGTFDAVLLLGPTGSGKTPLGDLLASRGLFGLTVHHLDFGSELRGSLFPPRIDRFSRSERSFIQGVLEHGLLLENEHFPLAAKVLSLFLERTGYRPGHLVVLNGLPRHQGQAAAMDGLCRIHAILLLECSSQDIACRIRDNTGGDRTGRMDDTSELIERKLSIYQERTFALVEHYERSGSRLYRLPVTGMQTPDEAYTSLLQLSAADPPVSLVAEPPER